MLIPYNPIFIDPQKLWFCPASIYELGTGNNFSVFSCNSPGFGRSSLFPIVSIAGGRASFCQGPNS